MKQWDQQVHAHISVPILGWAISVFFREGMVALGDRCERRGAPHSGSELDVQNQRLCKCKWRFHGPDFGLAKNICDHEKTILTVWYEMHGWQLGELITSRPLEIVQANHISYGSSSPPAQHYTYLSGTKNQYWVSDSFPQLAMSIIGLNLSV